MKEGWIYFILADGAESFVKIGFSSFCPWARMAGLETGCPLKLKIIGLVRGNQRLEREYHAAFSSLHHRGEWFRWSGILIEYLNTLEEPNSIYFHKTESRGRYCAGCAECHKIYLANAPRRRSLS